MRLNLSIILMILAVSCGGGSGGTSDPGSDQAAPDVPVTDMPATDTPAVDTPADTTPAGDEAVTPDGPADNPPAGDEGVAPDSPGYKYNTCQELFPCVQGCPEPDDACKQACVMQASPAAMADLMAVKTCLETECPVCQKPNPTPQEQEECEKCRGAAIFGGKCSEAFKKCQKFGDKKCGEVAACVKNCPDDPCADGCTTLATMTATSLLLPIVGCIANVCPNDHELPWNKCMEDAVNGPCKALFDDCINDKAGS